MQLFRSEEQVDAWCAARGRDRGAVFSPATLWALARRWYGDRLDHGWQRPSVAVRQGWLDEVGLTGPFWQIAASPGG